MPEFLPFLPPGSQSTEDWNASIDLIHGDVRHVLSLNDVEFWKVVRSTPSLHLLLRSFLRYARRPHEEGEDGACSPTYLDLSRCMLQLFLRL